MSNAAVIIELDGTGIKEANWGMVTMARMGGTPSEGTGDSKAGLIACIMTPVDDSMRSELESYGISTIVEVVLPQGLETNPDVSARALLSAVKAHQVSSVYGLSTALGKDLLPRMAALAGSPLVMDCFEADARTGMARTSQYSGKTLASIKMTGERIFFGVKPNSREPEKKPVSAEILRFDASDTAIQGLRVLDVQTGDQGKAVSLAEAEVIIAGGRGMKNAKNFDILVQCAEKLKAAVGASRVAVDSGWVPYAMQVGQTGEKVSPKVYIACGISGSIQHFAGMKMSGMVIALNTDENAAIMANCDYYAVADALEVIPAVTRILENG
ncbi:MAG: electron transfer flavoprotein subunit alpha/FixB family protein [Desulfobacteraceae bacterium]|nr:MAG: electron transfer flavoprotein subunit alpha/FixB family protein [Desulfobacteraceae bacterium]